MPSQIKKAQQQCATLLRSRKDCRSAGWYGAPTQNSTVIPTNFHDVSMMAAVHYFVFL